MPKAKKNDYQDWNIPSKDGPSKDGLGPRMVHEIPLSNPPSNDPDLKAGQGPALDEEIEIDVKELVRRYEENDIREVADGPDRKPAIDFNIKREKSDNHEEENLGPSFEHEEKYENQAFQLEETAPEPEETAPEPASFDHENPPLPDRGSSQYIKRQQSNGLPFDAAAACEASKNMYAERQSAPSVNKRNKSEKVPPAYEFDAAAAREASKQMYIRRVSK